MYTTCPKCKHERQAEEKINPDICPACGIIFSKWMKQKFSSPETKITTRNNIETSVFSGIIKTISSSLFFIEDKVNPFIFYGRAFVFIGIAV